MTDNGEKYGSNIWQDIARATNDILTPSNVIDGASMVGAKYSLDRLDSWQGITGAAASFLTDLVDGKIARATGTSSPLGEAVDAAGDKIKMAYGLIKINQLELAPKALVRAVATRNSLNAILSTADQVANGHNHKLHSSKLGQITIFLEQLAIGAHVIASQMDKNDIRDTKQLKLAANIIGWGGGVALGTLATINYARALRAPRTDV